MSKLIESMESRILFTASALVIRQDLAALVSTGDASKADLTAALATAKADAKTVKADVVAAHPTPAQKAVLNTFLKDERVAAATYKKQVSSILAAGFRDGKKLEAALIKLERNLTSTTIQAKVQTALTALQGVFSDTVVSGVESNASTTVTNLDTDQDAVATAVPSAQTDVGTSEGHFATDLTTLSTQASALQSEIATLAADLA